MCFYSRGLLSGHLNVHLFLEGRQLLILGDREDIEWKKSSSPPGGRRYCWAVENCKVVSLLQEPEPEARPPLGNLGNRQVPNKNRHHDQPGGALDHHACDDTGQSRHAPVGLTMGN